MRMSPNGIEMLKKFEGFMGVAYPDGPPGMYSIGYGHHGAKEGDRITGEEAEILLAKDLVRFEKGVESLLLVEVSQEQFDALVSYAYNCGLHALKSSQTLDHINNSRHEEAVMEWTRGWDSSPPGIIKRRRAEAELYAKGIA